MTAISIDSCWYKRACAGRCCLCVACRVPLRGMVDVALDVPECQDCGACCFGDGPRYVRVSGTDHSRMATQGDSLTHFIGNRCYMRVLHGHCEALAITATTHRYACLIYLTRPEPCRTLERGSGECSAERERKQGRAGLAVVT